jgi:hypothetical protein
MRPHRIAVRLGASRRFGGKGTLSHNAAGGLLVYDAAEAGTLLAMPHDIPGGTLAGGVTVYVQGATPSARMNDTTLTLALTTAEPKNNDPATDRLTRIELHLDLCAYKPTPGGADPAPLPANQRINPGRTLHVQTERRIAGRLMMIVRRTTPANYTGSVILKSLNDRVRPYAYAQEVPPLPPQPPDVKQPAPLTTANQSIDPALGLRLWVEGRKSSAALRDTGFTVEISDLPHREGDRAQITVVETQVDACQSRTKAGQTPPVVAKKDKMGSGRFLHVQDAGNHHGRARVVVQRVQPATYAGNLELTIWDRTASSAANPRARLFAAEAPGGAAFANPYPLAFPGGFPAGNEAEFWVGGAVVSGALRDTELRLKVHDAEGWADQAALTVCQFSALTADIPSTPAMTNRAGNSPVARHTYSIAAPAAGQNDFDEDYATNAPLVLIENAIRSADQVNLSVTVAPPLVPVRWAVIRDRRTAPNGDHADVIGLSGNKEAPTVAVHGIGLTNRMLADAVGSFHICPFVDCNGSGHFDFMEKNGARIDREPFIMMNLVLVRVQGFKNDSVGQPVNCRPITPAPQTAANFAGFTTNSGGGTWTGPTSGWHADATVEVIGGGNDGLRGLDRVFGGWIQHIFLNDIRTVYNLPPPPAPPPPAPRPAALAPRSHQYAFISNLPNNVNFGNYHYIRTGETALNAADGGWCLTTPPLLDNAPILDVSPFGNEGTGGDSAVGSTSFQGGTTGAHGGGYPAPILRPSGIGQRWQREMWDAPGIGCRSTHISAGGTLASFRFHLGFRTDLCFWTSTDRVPDPTVNGAANRLYVSVYKCTWTPDFLIDFHPGTGVGTVKTAPKIKVTKEKSASNGRATPVDGLGLETRSPFALAWYAVDARA